MNLSLFVIFIGKSRAMLIGDWPPDISLSKKEKYRIIKERVAREMGGGKSFGRDPTPRLACPPSQ